MVDIVVYKFIEINRNSTVDYIQNNTEPIKASMVNLFKVIVKFSRILEWIGHIIICTIKSGTMEKSSIPRTFIWSKLKLSLKSVIQIVYA